MKIAQAAKALTEGKVINSANARATIRAFEREGTWFVKIEPIDNTGEMHMRLSRMQATWRLHDFALGPYKEIGADSPESAD